MASARPPLHRFLLHSLWVVVPFVVLLALTWRAWRADENTRSQRYLEDARQAAGRALEAADRNLGAWEPVPARPVDEAPSAAGATDEAARTARARYEAGEYEAVLGSPSTLRSEAGLSLRKLAALQLLRKESDPARLGELAAILTESLDFASPPFLEEAEKRFRTLGLPLPPCLDGWAERWRRAEVESNWLREMAAAREWPAATWREAGGVRYLIESTARRDSWRIRPEPEVREAADKALQDLRWGVADGLALRVTVGGREIAGPEGGFFLFDTVERGAWKNQVGLTDEVAYRRQDTRRRNLMAGVAALGGLAVVIGLVQAGRAYLRAVELARRQSEFMAAVSHEMRTPLAAVRLLAENLESGLAERTGQTGEHVRLIREESERLGGLVENVLAFSRGERKFVPEEFDVRAMIDEAVAPVGPLAAAKGVALVIEVGSFPEPPQGDAAALRRALLNLLDNALKHTPAEGTIRCEASPAAPGWWRIVVSDTGPGIPAAERARIFEPFYRIGDELRRATPGTGLGLALVKRTAEAHGGRVTATEAPGGGACFTVELPLGGSDGSDGSRRA